MHAIEGGENNFEDKKDSPVKMDRIQGGSGLHLPVCVIYGSFFGSVCRYVMDKTRPLRAL